MKLNCQFRKDWVELIERLKLDHFVSTLTTSFVFIFYSLTSVLTLSFHLLRVCRWSWISWPSSTSSTSVFSTPTSSWRSKSAGTSSGSPSALPSGTAPRSTTIFPSSKQSSSHHHFIQLVFFVPHSHSLVIKAQMVWCSSPTFFTRRCKLVFNSCCCVYSFLACQVKWSNTQKYNWRMYCSFGGFFLVFLFNRKEWHDSGLSEQHFCLNLFDFQTLASNPCVMLHAAAVFKKQNKTAVEEFAIQYDQKLRTRYVVSACAAPSAETWKHPSRLSLMWISVGSATFSQHVWWSVWFSVKTNEWNVWGPPGLLSKYILKYWKWNGWTGTSVLSVPDPAWRFCE